MRSREKIPTFEILGKASDPTEKNLKETHPNKASDFSNNVNLEDKPKEDRKNIVQPILEAVKAFKKDFKLKNLVEMLIRKKELKDYKSLNQRQLGYIGDRSVFSGNLKEKGSTVEYII